jgi:hypothetical protein
MIPSWPLSLRYIFSRLVDQQWIVIGRCKEFCFMGKCIFGPTVTKYLDGSGMERKWHKNFCPL